MASTFEEILHRSDRLTSKVSRSVGKHPNKGVKSSIDLALDDVFRSSESLWKRKRLGDDRTTDLQTSLLLAEKGLSISTLSGLAEKKAAEVEIEELVLPSSDCREMLAQISAENARRTSLQAERAFMNQRVVEVPCKEMKFRWKDTPEKSTPSNANVIVSTSMASLKEPFMSAFAEAVSDYISHKNKGVFATKLTEDSHRTNEESVISLWEQVMAPLEEKEAIYGEVEDVRNSTKWKIHIVDTTVKYLQDKFTKYMESVIESNLTVARCGGNPSVLSLINGFLNVKHHKSGKNQQQDGLTYGPNNHSLWEMVYICLRTGDVDAILSITESHLKSLPTSAALAIVLDSLKENKRISAENKLKLKAEWQGESKVCEDSYKKAIYCALLGGDASEVCSTLEDWLWLKLMPLSVDSAFSPAVFVQLQHMISIEYGEEYFIKDGGSYFVYFQALWLSGQYERAIEVLNKHDMKVHAVHIAILLYIHGLLVVEVHVSSALLVWQMNDPLLCSINLGRLILCYTKHFECIDVTRALDYAYFLRNFESPAGGNLFYAYISRMVYLSGDVDHIIGKINENGVRQVGLIDRYSDDININDAIAKVASDGEVSDKITLAGRLYKAADHTNDAVRLACDTLAKEIVKHGNNDEAYNLAKWLASIYKRLKTQCTLLPTLHLLLDIWIFFQYFENEKFDICLEILGAIKCMPKCASEVTTFVSSFYMVPEQIRAVLPDLCLAAMNIMVANFRSEPQDNDIVHSWAKAIVQYVALIPYHFPAQINSQILELSLAFEK